MARVDVLAIEGPDTKPENVYIDFQKVSEFKYKSNYIMVALSGKRLLGARAVDARGIDWTCA